MGWQGRTKRAVAKNHEAITEVGIVKRTTHIDPRTGDRESAAAIYYWNDQGYGVPKRSTLGPAILKGKPKQALKEHFENAQRRGKKRGFHVSGNRQGLSDH